MDYPLLQKLKVIAFFHTALFTAYTGLPPDVNAKSQGSPSCTDVDITHQAT